MQTTSLLEQIPPFIVEHWPNFVALLIILIFILVNEALSKKNQATSLSPAQVVELINNENALIIDLRNANAFRAGHIIDALNASAEDFEKNKMDKYKAKSIVLVCANGTQSASLATKLRKKQFEKPFVLTGGMTEWETNALPLVKGKN